MKKNHLTETKKRQEWPAVVYFWIMGLTVGSYILARLALDGRPHPVHWLFGLLGGLVGIPIGWMWYHRHGDLF